MKLRPIQEVTKNDCIPFLTRKSRSKKNIAGICVCPTGYGKSIIIAELIKELGDGVLILQPSKELLEQNISKLMLVSDIKPSIYSASLNTKIVSSVTFATIGSIKNVSSLFSFVKYLIIDECHLYAGKSDSVFSKFMKEFEGIRVLGLTATPFKLKSSMDFNGIPTSKTVMLHKLRPSFFKEFVHITQIQDNLMYWSKTKYITEEFSGKGLKTNTTGMDYTDSSMKAVSKTLYEKIVSHCNSSEYRHILVFVTSIDDAIALSRLVPNSDYVTGETAKSDRERILSEFKKGIIKTVFNVGVLTTGFDFPSLDCVILARPTLSVSLYYQMVGRVVRMCEGKELSYIIDLVGNFKKFGRVEDFVIEDRGEGINLYSGENKISAENMSNILEKKEADAMTDFEDIEIDFGKHKGTKLSEIPKGYLTWIVENVTGKPKLIKNINLFLAQKVEDKSQLLTQN